MTKNELTKMSALAPIYIRVSNDEQVEEGASLEAQLANAIAYAEALGIKVLETPFVDAGVSASKVPLPKRKGLVEFLKYIEEDKPQYALVWKRDRLVRSVYEYASILKVLEKAGTKLLFFGKGEPPMGQGVYGDVQEAMIVTFAQLESKLIRQRILDTRKNLVKSGQIITTKPAYGYRYNVENRSYETVPEEIENVKKVYNMYLYEKKGYTRISRELNHVLSVSAVRCILKNSFYCGIQRSSYIDEIDGKEVRITEYIRTDRIEPCVSEEDFNKVQLMMKNKNDSCEAPRKYSTSSLLSGLLYCGNCGEKCFSQQSSSKNTTIKGKVTTYRHSGYRCSRNMKGYKYCFQVSRHKLDTAVVDGILNTMANLDFHRIVNLAEKQVSKELVDLNTELNSLRKKVIDIENKIERNQELLERSSSARMRDHYQERIEDLLETREATSLSLNKKTILIEKIKDAKIEKANFYEKLKNWKQLFKEAGTDIKRVMLLDVVEKVIFDPSSRTAKVILKLDQQLLSEICVFSDAGSSQHTKEHEITKIAFTVKVA